MTVRCAVTRHGSAGSLDHAALAYHHPPPRLCPRCAGCQQPALTSGRPTLKRCYAERPQPKIHARHRALRQICFGQTAIYAMILYIIPQYIDFYKQFLHSFVKYYPFFTFLFENGRFGAIIILKGRTSRPVSPRGRRQAPAAP